jgi:hypothetical protein
VAKAFVAMHRAGLHGTLTEGLGAESQRWRAVAELALAELDVREARALQELAADPPAHLVAAIGRPERPGLDAGAVQSPWLVVAGHIVAYRLEYGISDPTRALGARPSQSVSLARETDWRFVLGEIRWSTGNLGERLADPRVLGVFDPTGAVIPQHALDTLSGERSARGRIAPASERRIRAAPSHWLRERVTGALGLLQQRPANCLAELEQLEAVRRATQVLYQKELAGPHQPGALGRPRTLQEQRGEQLSRRLRDLDAAIAGARRAWHQRAAWTTRHAEALAAGRLAAEELAWREHQALAALEEDPPQYLVAELGPPPAGTTGMRTWRHGVRLIERHRTCQEIGDPARAFDSGRDQVARDHEAAIRQQVKLVRGALELGGNGTLALPEPPHQLLSGP